MDLYLFYNCVNNISEIIETPEKEISLRHELMINDPLIHKFYLDNLSKIPKSINSSSYIGGGGEGALGKAAASKGAPPGATPGAPAGGPPGAPAPDGKGKKGKKGKKDKKDKKGDKEGDNKKDGDAANNKAKSEAEAEEDKALEEEVEKASEASENAGELDGLKKILKTLTRLIVGFLTILMLPLVPWVMITIYSFKNLANFFEINTNRL